MVENGYLQEGGDRKIALWLRVLIGCGVIAVLAVVLAIITTTVIPRLWPRPDRHAHFEYAAVGSCCAYAGAQILYRKANNQYANPYTKLYNASDPTKCYNAKDFVDARGPTGDPKQGYHFQECKTIGGKPIDWTKEFAFCAIPSQYGKTGHRSFIVTTDGTVYGKDQGPKGTFVTDFPANLKAAGWELAE